MLEISETFERYSGDFGRKLYLIQNSIFGIDIQPVACQIAKLRFFISLAIEQEADETADNFGIKPLPNLETRFVAANTLIGLQLSEVRSLLQDDAVQQNRKQIEAIREKYFLANNRPQKLRYIRQEEKCRKRLKSALEFKRAEWAEREQREVDRKVTQLPKERDRRSLRKQLWTDYKSREEKLNSSLEDAQKIARWNPYDQNAVADWFDAEYMFGFDEGFDVVIGNPPYIQLQKNGGELGKLYKDTGYETFARTGDIYQLFYERGCRLLRPPQGLLTYITSNSWLKAEYGKALRRYLSERHTPLRLLEMGKDVFENAIVDTNILIVRHCHNGATCKAVDMDRLSDKSFPPAESLWGELRLQGEKSWSALSAIEQSIMDKMEAVGTPLKEWDIAINYGIKTGYNDAFIIDNDTKEALITEDPRSADILKPVLRGRDIKRYRAEWAELWLIDTHNGYGSVPAVDIDEYPAIKNHLDAFYPQLKKRQDKGRTPYNLRNCAYHEVFDEEKLVWIELVENGRFAYDDSGIYCEATTFMMTGENLKYLCAVLNAKLVRWFLQQIAPTSGMGILRWKKVYVETVPIPKLSMGDQAPFIELVDCILTAKATDPKANVSATEAEIDLRVCELYGLKETEILAVEKRPLP